MSKSEYIRAEKPTYYFIGVTTGSSSIMRVFPEWARYLKLGDCRLEGIDFRPHDEPQAYREAVQFIKQDPLSLGALVTTHKIDLLAACRDLFDELDPYARLTGEVSCISKHGGKLWGQAKDPISSGLSLESVLPPGYWERTGAEVFVIGAGGSAIAITVYLLKAEHGANRPARIIVSNRSRPRLEEIRRIHDSLDDPVPREYHLTPAPEDNDAIVNNLGEGALVINATGLGKDSPGSPLTDRVLFPRRAIAWDFNYRGDLQFIKQARSQQRERELVVEDGWTYFVHGWTRGIAEVFSIEIPTSGPRFEELSRIASRARS